ncbi:MAG: ribosome-associated translation inhibitor RaiA [Chloroflexota bacterium]|nr:MAG: ribosome-associated translation inhibitor RaiA [Chloroflexota bacterium]
MEISIQGLNVKVSDAIEAYARKKLDRLDRYLPGITEVKLDLSTQNSRRGGTVRIAQLTVYHRRGAILRAEESVNGDFEAAINLAIDKMYRRIERFKGKRVAKRKGAERFSATVEELALAEELPEEVTSVEPEEIAEAAEQAAEVIVRRKQVNLTAMTEAEAIEQMELLGHDFFMFYNADSGSINVLYRREAGGYGLLLPELA